MRSNYPAPIPLSSVKDRARRRASTRSAAAREQPPERSAGRAWINGREVAPNPSLAHLSLSYD
jgi:hypothetical protein